MNTPRLRSATPKGSLSGAEMNLTLRLGFARRPFYCCRKEYASASLGDPQRFIERSRNEPYFTPRLRSATFCCSRKEKRGLLSVVRLRSLTRAEAPSLDFKEYTSASLGDLL
jgi:hypothetical protein